MKIISKRAAGKTLSGDSFSFAQQAKAAKRAGFDVLDATLGTFYYDDGSFRGFEAVKEIFRSLPDEDYFSYAPIAGGIPFASAVLDWVFRASRAAIEKEMTARVVPTPGGTGAISSAVFLTLDHGKSVLIPDLAWGPYDGIAANFGVRTERFKFFAGNVFNFEDFRLKGEAVAQRDGKLAVIINDPCHNPTGYTLSPGELSRIIAYLNEKKDTPCVLIYDIAYLDYSNEGREAARRKLEILTKAEPHVLIAVAFSASKSFCAYGQRLGALIMMNKNEDVVEELFRSLAFHARHSWSNANRAMISMMTAIATDEGLRRRLDDEIDIVVGELRERSAIFLAEAKSAGLAVYPYHGGFFLTVPARDNEKTLRDLREKEHFYFLPFRESLRVAICAIPKNKLKGVAATVKKYCPD